MRFCLKLPQCLYYMSANSKGSGETAHMCRLARAFPGRLYDKYLFLCAGSVCVDVNAKSRNVLHFVLASTQNVNFSISTFRITTLRWKNSSLPSLSNLCMSNPMTVEENLSKFIDVHLTLSPSNFWHGLLHLWITTHSYLQIGFSVKNQ